MSFSPKMWKKFSQKLPFLLLSVDLSKNCHFWENLTTFWRKWQNFVICFTSVVLVWAPGVVVFWCLFFRAVRTLTFRRGKHVYHSMPHTVFIPSFTYITAVEFLHIKTACFDFFLLKWADKICHNYL